MAKSAEEQRKKFLSVVHGDGDISPEGSGEFVFWSGRFGYLTSYQMRWIADELDRLNAPYWEEMAKYFEVKND